MTRDGKKGDGKAGSGGFSVSRRGVLLGASALTAALFLPKALKAADYPTAAVNTTEHSARSSVSPRTSTCPARPITTG